MRVAIFDFDGTLYEKETFSILMKQLKNHPIYHTKYNRFFWSILPIYIAYKLKIYPEPKMKELSMHLYLSAFHHISKGELHTYFDEIAEKMRANFNPTVVSRLEQHIADGFYVMLVSGAYTQLLHSATRGLHFDRIIGTDTPLNKQFVDKNMPLHHVQGTRKNKVIHVALEGKDIDWENSYAYGDSYSDLSVLELVGNPVAVKPESKLQWIAKKRGWKII